MNSILKKYLVCGLAFASLASGCTEKDLDSRADEGYVEIVLDWGSARPAGKRFDFYPVEGGDPLTFSSDAPECNVAGCEGFKGILPSGDYRMIVASCEEDQCVEFRNSHSYESAAFFVSHVGTRAGEVKGYENRIEHVGRLMFTRHLDPVDGSADNTILRVPYQQKVKRSATPKSYVKQVRLNFRIDNPETITKCEGVFVGVAESVNCSTGSCSATTASIDFTATRTREGGSGVGFTAEFSVLDLIDPADKTSGVHTVYLTLTKTDGSKLTTTIDVTNAVQDLIGVSGGTIPIDIPLELKLEVLKDGTLSATVTAWKDGTGEGDVISGSLE
ncbi:MAG: DUF5119 domain-containing protein [Alistipes senegalensis]|nr:DUF5119 domain-containing protein [Bacteroides cellulosilyticus]MCM1353046.1 DUF5119 domain-containing protein [Alistipes senegalensis]